MKAGNEYQNIIRNARLKWVTSSEELASQARRRGKRSGRWLITDSSAERQSMPASTVAILI